MDLPQFRYHPDPIRSGSVVESQEMCKSCGQSRGYIYAGPVYSEEELDDAICPWCIADGSAHKKFDAEFVDSNGFRDGVPESVMEEISQRTPGFNAWQTEEWPACCNDAMAFLMPTGIEEIRKDMYEVEGAVMGYIVQEMQISGGAARKLLESLRKDESGQPTLYLFQCLHCQRHGFHIDWV